LKLEEGDKDITITVIDDGIGISEDEQQHLFDIFYRGNSVIGKYSGFGFRFEYREKVLLIKLMLKFSLKAKKV